MAYSDRELLARMIQCESGGEGDNGMKATASVIMNRVNASTGEYARVSNGGSIRNILFQPDQFTCAKESVFNEYNPQNIYNMNPTDLEYYIADWAISGNRFSIIDNSLWYVNPFKPDCNPYFPVNQTGVIHTRYGKHCFYIPTAKYAQT